MIEFDEKSLRDGCNLTGVLMMTTGFGGLFLKEDSGWPESSLALFGLFLYVVSTVTLRLKTAGE